MLYLQITVLTQNLTHLWHHLLQMANADITKYGVIQLDYLFCIILIICLQVYWCVHWGKNFARGIAPFVWALFDRREVPWQKSEWQKPDRLSNQKNTHLFWNFNLCDLEGGRARKIIGNVRQSHAFNNLQRDQSI